MEKPKNIPETISLKGKKALISADSGFCRHKNMSKPDSYFQKIYKIVKHIPKGKVATYGQVAALCGSPRGARTVGWALHVLPEKRLKEVPWHRVINREGRISTTCLEHSADQQAYLLKKEGVEVIKREGDWWIDLKKYLWKV